MARAMLPAKHEGELSMNEATDEAPAEEPGMDAAEWVRKLAGSINWQRLIATRPGIVLAGAFGIGLLVSLGAGLWYRNRDS
jgi:hypothetical protein